MGVSLTRSHASPNTEDGLNFFDGSRDQYFAPGEAGDHALWKSKCFDYKKKEVVQFLLGQPKGNNTAALPSGHRTASGCPM